MDIMSRCASVLDFPPKGAFDPFFDGGQGSGRLRRRRSCHRQRRLVGVWAAATLAFPLEA